MDWIVLCASALMFVASLVIYWRAVQIRRDVIRSLDGMLTTVKAALRPAAKSGSSLTAEEIAGEVERRQAEFRLNYPLGLD